MPSGDSRHSKLALAVASIVVSALGAAVMGGWLSGRVEIVQILPHTAPMQFNTALCFLLAGIATLLLVLNSRWPVRLLGASVAAIAMATLAQYVFGLAFGLDEFFIRHDVVTETSHSGRMGPNTAVCFLLSGVSILLFSVRANQSGIFAAALLQGLAVISLIGYMSQMEAAYGWSSYTRMAPHTAFGFAVLGGVLWGHWLACRVTKIAYSAVAAGLAMLTMTLCLWQAMQTEQYRGVREHVRTRGALVTALLDARADDRLRALHRMAGRFEHENGSAEQQWRSDAARYLRDLSELTSIAVLDDALNVQWVEPETAGTRRFAKNAVDELRRALGVAPESPEMLMVQLPGERGEAYTAGVAIRLEHAENVTGYLLTSLALDNLLTPFMAEERRDVEFAIRDKEIGVSSLAGRAALLDRPFRETFDLNLFGRDVEIVVSPTPAFLRLAQSGLPAVVLMAGMLVSASAAALIWAAARTYRTRLALLTQQAAHKLVTDHISTLILQCDDRMICRMANPAFARVFGCQVQNVPGRALSDLLPKPQHEAVRGYLESALTGEHRRLVLEMPDAQGHTRWLDVSIVPSHTDAGQIDGAYFFATDNTRQRNEEEAHIKSERRLRLALDASGIGVWEWHIPSNEFLTDTRMREMYGLECDGAVTFEDFAGKILTEDADRVHEEIQHAIATHTSLRTEFRIAQSDGQRRFIRGLGLPIAGADGATLDFIGVNYDITERREAQVLLQGVNDELEQRVEQRTAALKTANEELEAFSYSVSHDLRAPLRHMSGFIKLLAKQVNGNLDEKSMHYMDQIQTSSDRLGRLIDELLSFARMGRAALHVEPVNLQQLVSAVREEHEDLCRGREVRWDISPLPTCNVDGSMLRLVFQNLIENALKFTRRQTVAEIRIWCEIEDESIRFYVADNGVGFDMTFADKLFGVFQRLHHRNEFEGTGVGLATVRRIVTKHGGSVSAHSSLGAGATISFALPLNSLPKELLANA